MYVISFFATICINSYTFSNKRFYLELGWNMARDTNVFYELVLELSICRTYNIFVASSQNHLGRFNFKSNRPIRTHSAQQKIIANFSTELLTKQFSKKITGNPLSTTQSVINLYYNFHTIA